MDFKWKGKRNKRLDNFWKTSNIVLSSHSI